MIHFNAFVQISEIDFCSYMIYLNCAINYLILTKRTIIDKLIMT